jgi:hypothetical protein
MNFAIYCLDDPGTPDARDNHYPDHRAFLNAPPSPIVIAGPLLETDTERRIGSLLVIEAETTEEAMMFAQSDPFYKNKVWKSVEVRPFLKAVDNR